MKGLIIVLLTLGFYCKDDKPSITDLNIVKVGTDSVRIEFEIVYPSLEFIMTHIGHIDTSGCNIKNCNFNYLEGSEKKKLRGTCVPILVNGNKYSFVIKNDFGGEVNYLAIEVGDNKGNESKPVYYKNSKSLEFKYCQK